MAPKPISTGTRAPCPLVRGPLIRLPNTLTTAEGRNASPAHSGVRPRYCCRYRLVTNTVPYQRTMKENPGVREMRMSTVRNSSNGTIG